MGAEEPGASPDFRVLGRAACRRRREIRGKSEGNEHQQMGKSPALHDTALEGAILAQDRALTAELSPPIQTNLSLALLPY